MLLGAVVATATHVAYGAEVVEVVLDAALRLAPPKHSLHLSATMPCHLAEVHTSMLRVQDEVLIAGFGRSGHAVGDIPGVRFKVGSKAFSLPAWCLCIQTGGA